MVDPQAKMEEGRTDASAAPPESALPNEPNGGDNATNKVDSTVVNHAPPPGQQQASVSLQDKQDPIQAKLMLQYATNTTTTVSATGGEASSAQDPAQAKRILQYAREASSGVVVNASTSADAENPSNLAEPDGASVVDGIEPLPLNRQARQAQQPTQPGAYPRAGINHPTDPNPEDYGTDFEEYSTNNPPPPPQEEGLIEATPVRNSLVNNPNENNTANQTLVVVSGEIGATEAQIIPPKSLASQFKSLSTKSKLLCSIVALLVLGGALFGAVYGVTRQDTATLAPSIAPSQSPTMAPTQYALELPPFSSQLMDDTTSVPYRAYLWILAEYGYERFSGFPQWRKEQIFALVSFLMAFDGTTRPGILLSNVVFNGSIPECSWDNVHIYLDCDPEGRIHSFGIMTSPSKIEGFVPAEVELLHNLEKFWIQDLRLQGNLSGLVHPRLANVPLQHFALGNNDVMGTIPPTLYRLTQLTTLDLHRNELTGTLSSQLGMLTQLELLDLSTNEFAGSLPSEIGLMTSLDTIKLYKTRLTGTLPTQLGLLTNLTYLNGHSLGFTGTLPSQLGLLTALTSLRLHNNMEITGTVPEELCRLTRGDDGNATDLVFSIGECGGGNNNGGGGGGSNNGGGGGGGGSNNGGGGGNRHLQNTIVCPENCICSCSRS